jgi:hypothetical protein
MEKVAVISDKDGNRYRASHLSRGRYLVVLSSSNDIYAKGLPSDIWNAPAGERGPNLKRYIKQIFGDGLGTLVTVRRLQVDGPYPWKENKTVSEGTDAVEIANRYAKTKKR